MKRIEKGAEARAFKRWKRLNPGKGYNQIEDSSVRRAERETLIAEQKGLCCYCYAGIDVDNSHVEHLRSKGKFPVSQLAHDNLLASCHGGPNRDHCGHRKKVDIIPITPLQEEWDAAFDFRIDGKIKDTGKVSRSVIDTLNLDSRRLRELRTRAFEGFFYMELDPDITRYLSDSTVIDPELAEAMMSYLGETGRDGRLQEFAPATINIIQQLIG